MAKKRKKSSSFGLGILDGLIDLAGGAAMNAVANHMEKKYHYAEKGKINPYRVSAIGIASGRMKTTRQIMRTGAYLGAKGSFNVTTDPPGKDPNERTWSDSEDEFIVSDDPLLNAISDSVTNDNRYAWRLNCEPGWQYGIDPEDYETREEYNEALEQQKSDMDMEQKCQEDYFEDWAVIPEEVTVKDTHNSPLCKKVLDICNFFFFFALFPSFFFLSRNPPLLKLIHLAVNTRGGTFTRKNCAMPGTQKEPSAEKMRRESPRRSFRISWRCSAQMERKGRHCVPV